MESRGQLSRLVGEHVQIIDPLQTDLKRIDEHGEEDEKQEELTASRSDAVLPYPNEGLTANQLNNRRRLSITAQIDQSDHQIARHIEDHQMDLLSVRRDSFNAIKIMEKNRMSIVTEHDDDSDEVMPSDAEPMKLVQDDQSIFYKKSPVMAYMRAGAGFIATVSVFLLFFLVHGVRIGSGKQNVLYIIFRMSLYKQLFFFLVKITGYRNGSRKQAVAVHLSVTRCLLACTAER
jgi:hypothetical protein